MLPETAAVLGLFRTVTATMDPTIVRHGSRTDPVGGLDAPRAIFYPPRPEGGGDPNCSAFAEGMSEITAVGSFGEHLRTAYEQGWLPVVKVTPPLPTPTHPPTHPPTPM